MITLKNILRFQFIRGLAKKKTDLYLFQIRGQVFQPVSRYWAMSGQIIYIQNQHWMRY